MLAWVSEITSQTTVLFVILYVTFRRLGAQFIVEARLHVRQYLHGSLVVLDGFVQFAATLQLHSVQEQLLRLNQTWIS